MERAAPFKSLEQRMLKYKQECEARFANDLQTEKKSFDATMVYAQNKRQVQPNLTKAHSWTKGDGGQARSKRLETEFLEIFLEIEMSVQLFKVLVLST